MIHTLPKTPEKRAPRGARSAVGRIATWPDVVRAVPDPSTRSRLAGAIREAGFSLDSLPTRSAARAALADALTREEDRVELRRSCPTQQAELYALRALRRAIEAEVWP